MKVIFKMEVVEKTTLPVSGVYQRIYLQGQLFIHGLSAAESFASLQFSLLYISSYVTVIMFFVHLFVFKIYLVYCSFEREADTLSSHNKKTTTVSISRPPCRCPSRQLTHPPVPASKGCI